MRLVIACTAGLTRPAWRPEGGQRGLGNNPRDANETSVDCLVAGTVSASHYRLLGMRLTEEAACCSHCAHNCICCVALVRRYTHTHSVDWTMLLLKTAFAATARTIHTILGNAASALQSLSWSFANFFSQIPCPALPCPFLSYRR
jgi:hypothetical protein